uniref:receptor protein-tyrosine kinase n=1 Tax=Esox lucius TaxID=8010 RepID=A0A6Q2YFG0_ESOLU
GNVTSSLGKPVKVECTLQVRGGDDEYAPDVIWQRDRQLLDDAETNQYLFLPFPSPFPRLPLFSLFASPPILSRFVPLALHDSPTSSSFHLGIPGLPHFSVEPRHHSVVANVSLSLQCVALGPPEPVHVIWLQDGAPLNRLEDPVALSPSTLNITGLNRTSTFSCEAHNRKGVATSGSGTVTVLPSQPLKVTAVEVTNSSLLLTWQPGFGGVYPITHCTVQARRSGEDVAVDGLHRMIHNQNVNVPPASYQIRGLDPHSLYAVRLACHSSQGASDWTPWVTLQTEEGGGTLLSITGAVEELKQKLQDVMVDRHKLTLGKTLGEGEFGSVMEGSLIQEESVLKVAVKTMKIAICTRSEMEDFLREAACMKEFDHQNVMRLLGVCLQTVESEGYPSPVVILPYMKHGDLHSYLLYSRLGDCPVYLPSHMLVKFMMDIAKGMEYLSCKNFIHRDLAARNCMLNENMNVCVADFGLSKKIYNGDYYRQGRISKMPVKWIAIESLADRVYTTKSDVWSFGVTMWEIATRGQTPYPGVENSEIYDYLRQGNRLKQPPDCLDSIYAMMFSCWLLSPKDRPQFETLRRELEKTLKDLPDPQDPDEILYVNMDESLEPGPLGAVGGRDPAGGLKGRDSVATVDVHHTHPSRYVLCPQHDSNTNRLLSDSLESLNLVSSSSATLPLGATLSLQRFGCSTPAPTPPPTADIQGNRDGLRMASWQ